MIPAKPQPLTHAFTFTHCLHSHFSEHRNLKRRPENFQAAFRVLDSRQNQPMSSMRCSDSLASLAIGSGTMIWLTT